MDLKTALEDQPVQPNLPGAGGAARRPKRIALTDAHQRHAKIGAILRSEIVPRLLLIHHEIRKNAGSAPPNQAEIEEFGRLAMKPDSASATAYFAAMRAKGHSIDTLFVDFLAPTARHLGELWEQDRVDFIDVTLGVARLHELLEMFGFAQEIVGDDLRHRAILIAPPGEKHLFGIDMVAKFFRASGWTVTLEIEHTLEHNLRSVADEWIGCVGLTMSSEVRVETLARTIDLIRRNSLNPGIGVIVGGPAFGRDPDLVAQVGADAAANDAPTAVILAKKLLLRAATRN